VKGGDTVSCTVSDLTPLRAEAEDIPLDIVYEDEHLLVVNKPAHMVCTIFSALIWDSKICLVLRDVALKVLLCTLV
jgi:hypothetical protein